MKYILSIGNTDYVLKSDTNVPAVMKVLADARELEYGYGWRTPRRASEEAPSIALTIVADDLVILPGKTVPKARRIPAVSNHPEKGQD